jgi:hypothetical protein
LGLALVLAGLVAAERGGTSSGRPAGSIAALAPSFGLGRPCPGQCTAIMTSGSAVRNLRSPSS